MIAATRNAVWYPETVAETRPAAFVPAWMSELERLGRQRRQDRQAERAADLLGDV